MATRKVDLNVTLRLVIEYDETITINEALDQIKVISETAPDDVDIIDFSIENYKVEDSK